MPYAHGPWPTPDPQPPALNHQPCCQAPTPIPQPNIDPQHQPVIINLFPLVS